MTPMATIANIVCPVDLSDVSKRALQYAVALGEAHGAHLHVLSVFDVGLPPATNGPALFELGDDARKGLEEDLNWFVAPMLRESVPTQVHLREGRVVSEVLRAAESLTSPLIVMGTHGRSGFERLALGSVAEKVLRKASCSVLAVPPVAGGRGIVFRRIVCATDFSDTAERALEYAEDLAEPSSANLLLLHVVEWLFGQTTGPDAVTSLRQSLEAEAADQMTALASRARGRVAERAVVTGKPASEILAFAQRRDADLIVMGVSGRGAIDLAIMGSTTHRVLRDAPCPVLTIPLRD